MHYKRAGRVIAIVLLFYAALVGANLGEFWPFSIYPMFSQGGHPWSRAAVLDVTEVDGFSWTSTTLAGLPGKPYPVLEHGVDHIDLANFVSKTKVWNDDRVAGLRNMFAAHELGDRRLLVLRVNGSITPEDSVALEFVPYVLITSEETTLNPALTR